MSNMSKNMKQALAILIAIFAAFTICVFVIPFHKGGTFWICYIAEVVALGTQIPVFKLAFDNRDELKSKLLGFPIFRVGYIYIGIQTAASLLLMTLGAAVKSFPVWVSAVLCVIILAGAFICSMAADIARDEVERIEVASHKDTSYMNGLKAESASLPALTDNKELKAKLEKLAESIRFSDPVSSEAITLDEQALAMKFSELSSAVSSGADNASALCDEVVKLLNVRNAKCKANK